MKFVSVFIAVLLAVGSANAAAQGMPGMSMPAKTAASSAAMPLVQGEVRKVDKEQGKVTLRHGPLQNLDMPPMTMVFKAADPKLLDGLKEGDKVKFTAEKVNGAITVTAIQVAK